MSSTSDLPGVHAVPPMEVILISDEEEDQKPPLPKMHREALDVIKFFSFSPPTSATEQAVY